MWRLGQTAPLGRTLNPCKRPNGAVLEEPSPKSDMGTSACDDYKFCKEIKHAAVTAAAATVLAFGPLPVYAADTVAVGSCVLRSCQTQLAQCIGDANCFKNLICIQGCQGRPDEQDCEIRCGDQYEDKAVTVFNACAVSEKQCVPQVVTEDAYPLPRDSVLDNAFKTTDFQGRWYITAGYNKLFDTFDCQDHYFVSPEPGKLFAKIQWRIQRPDGDFLERETVQRFLQDPECSSKLYNRGNEYLHYEDDWYIVAWKPDEYAFIYYKGNNDAWRGYGGATVYTRAASFPSEYAPVMEKAAAAVGLNWAEFTLTDNSCPPHPPKSPFNIFNPLLRGAQRLEASLEEDLRSFGRGFTVVESGIVRELTAEEKLVERELEAAGKALEKMEQQYLGKKVVTFTRS